MRLFISIDAPDVPRRIDRLAFANEVEEVRKVNQRTDKSREIWRSWALKEGGDIISENGASVRLQMPADTVGDLEPLRMQYAHALDSKVAIGLGTELQHADRALKASIEMGGGILPYSDYVEEVLSPKEPASPFAKSDVVAMNPEAYAGAKHPARPTVEKPVATQGDHSAGQVARDAYESSERPPAPEGTHAAQDFEEQLHGHAQSQDEEDKREQLASDQQYDVARQKLVESMKMLKEQAPVMEQLKQQAPDAYQAMIGFAEAVTQLARLLRGQDPNQPAAIQKSEVDEIGPFEPLQKMALIHNDPKQPKFVYRIQNENGEGPYEQDSLDSGFPQTKFDLPERNNKDFYQPLPENDFSPEDMDEFRGQDPETGNGAGHYSFAFERPHQATRWFGSDGIQALYENGYRLKQIPAQKIYRSGSGHQVFFEHHPSYDWQNPQDAEGFDHPTPDPKAVKPKRSRAKKKPMAKDEMEKAALPMPEQDGVPSKRPVQLPVGAKRDYKIKVKHGDGKTGWIQARAGEIMSADGHPISSRNPHGR